MIHYIIAVNWEAEKCTRSHLKQSRDMSCGRNMGVDFADFMEDRGAWFRGENEFGGAREIVSFS